MSPVNDSMQGFDREDVAGPGDRETPRLARRRRSRSPGQPHPERLYLALGTSWTWFRRSTEPRVLTITDSSPTQQTESVQINTPTPEGRDAQRSHRRRVRR